MKIPSLAEAKKAVVSVVGLAALLASTGTFHGTAETVVNAILAAATAAGVYGVRNAPSSLAAKPPVSHTDPFTSGSSAPGN